MPSPREAVALVQAVWQEAFAARDVPMLVRLYTEDAAFYGSQAELLCGHAGVFNYFSKLPSRFRRARFAESALVLPTPGVIVASGPVTFDVEDEGTSCALLYRVTQVFVERDRVWLIAAHHASPRPA